VREGRRGGRGGDGGGRFRFGKRTGRGSGPGRDSVGWLPSRGGQGAAARCEERVGTRRRREVGEGAPNGWAPRVSERGTEGGGGRAADGPFGPISAGD
jgi:hypothetical protein